jgi:hypothetical protein
VLSVTRHKGLLTVSLIVVSWLGRIGVGCPRSASVSRCSP